MESYDFVFSSEIYDVGTSEEAASEEAVSAGSASEESALEESAPEEAASEESALEESAPEEAVPEESATSAELYSAEVVASIDTLAANLEHTNLLLMCFFVVFCVVSLRNIVFGIRKNIFGR